MKKSIKQKSKDLKLGKYLLSFNITNFNYVNFGIKKRSFWCGKCKVAGIYTEIRIEIYLGKWNINIDLYKFKSKKQRDMTFQF